MNPSELLDHTSKVHFVPFRWKSADLGWAISTGPESKYNGISDLKGSSIAISRIGRLSGMILEIDQ
jgi:hypothetical protein